MYNAKRRFGDAEKASREGDQAEAVQAYSESIEKAAVSYRGHPRGRWADDALFLIGRARFALGEYEAARAAFVTLLEMQPAAEIRAGTLAYLGAAEVQLGNAAEAASRLDAVVADASADPQLRSFAQLWRARARFRAGQPEAALADLDALIASGGSQQTAAALEAAFRAVELSDSARFRSAFNVLADHREGARWSDTLGVLVPSARVQFGPHFTQSALERVERGDWPQSARERHALARVEMLAESGDTLNAVSQAVRFAERASAPFARRARVFAARLALATADSVPELARARALLLPVLDDPGARTLIRSMKAVDVLLERAAEGQPLALFAAAELAREELHSLRLSRQWFLAYAEIVPDAVWAPKALLAAAALADSAAQHEEITKRFNAHHENVYVRALKGGADDGTYAVTEDRLSRSLAAVREDAFAAADARDVSVGSAVARLDSLKARAVADSLKLACGAMLDSLALKGIRADSVRSACLRRDADRVALLMKIDTLLLRDSTRADTLARRRRPVRDTTAAGTR
jgi:tetratricopeptide (TPR) repeat protein